MTIILLTAKNSYEQKQSSSCFTLGRLVQAKNGDFISAFSYLLQKLSHSGTVVDTLLGNYSIKFSPILGILINTHT